MNKVKTRIVHKHDTQENWEKASNFIPLAGELIFYTPDENNQLTRVKVGDGKTSVSNLPFVTKNIYVQSEEPLDAPEGSIWFDTSLDVTGE